MITGPPRELTPSELIIHRLYGITAQYGRGFDEQLKELLEMGLERFSMTVGIVSRIYAGTYEVVAAVTPPGVSVRAGDTFELSDTYCSMTYTSPGPVAVEHAAESEVAHLPAYEIFKLESYIGVPLRIGDEIYGTLNFSSTSPRESPFEPVDADCIQLMAGWLAGELDRRQVIAELEEARHQLERLVTIDPLTELQNRRGVVDTLARVSRRQVHDGGTLTCVLVDIDDFKQVNDRFGLSVGDKVIQAVANCVRGSIRPTDTAGRIGGDEFLAILPGTSKAEAATIAARIIDAVQDLDVREGDSSVSVTVSIGVAEVPATTLSVSDVLTYTENLLKQSKVAGKNTVSF